MARQHWRALARDLGLPAGSEPAVIRAVASGRLTSLQHALDRPRTCTECGHTWREEPEPTASEWPDDHTPCTECGSRLYDPERDRCGSCGHPAPIPVEAVS
jgi:ribosomal protein L37E